MHNCLLHAFLGPSAAQKTKLSGWGLPLTPLGEDTMLSLDGMGKYPPQTYPLGASIAQSGQAPSIVFTSQRLRL